MKRATLLTCLVLLLPVTAFAQAATPASDPAGAQALFYEARSLMRRGSFSAACPKLEESLRLDYGIGTEFNLADCNEHIGRTATAWSGFSRVASRAKSLNQLERERVARARAKALEPKLPRLVIDVPAPPPGAEVKRDGALVGPAEWGVAVPVDPGPHKVAVTAPGKLPWESSANATESGTARVVVPRDLPSVVAIAAPSPPPQPPVPVLVVAPLVQTGSEPAPSSTPTDFPAPIVERGHAQRTIGWITGGAGLVGLVVGAGFGIDSIAKRRASSDHCRDNLCDQAGVNLRDDAIRSGNVSTIATIAGGTALVGGILLLVTAPISGERERRVLSAAPQVAQSGGGLTLQGVFR